MERGDQIVNNLSAISGLMRHEGRFAFSAELQEVIRYIRELEGNDGLHGSSNIHSNQRDSTQKTS